MATIELQTTAELAESRRKMQAKRRMKNRIALALSMATMAFGLFWLIWILMATITRGFDGMSLALFTEMTPPPNTAGGGLANALAGSGLLILWATVFGTPLGILAGIYLAEYGRKSVLAEIIRFINDILLPRRLSWWVCSSTPLWWRRCSTSRAGRALSRWRCCRCLSLFVPPKTC